MKLPDGLFWIGGPNTFFPFLSFLKMSSVVHPPFIAKRIGCKTGPMSPEKKAAMLAKRAATLANKKAAAEKQRLRDADNLRWYNGYYARNY